MILAILQARVSSSRLYGKALKPILGKEMLLHQIERIQHSKKIDKLVVATSKDSLDDSIETMCRNNNILVFRGDLDNVLDRFYRCATKYNTKHIVRLTGDCPIIDWDIIDNVIDYYLNNSFDYVVTSLEFPDGLDVEILSMDALSKANKNAISLVEKEHVTYYINQRKDDFKIGYYQNNVDLSYLRWSVDEPEDFVLIEKIYQKLYKNNPKFLTNDVLKLLKKEPLLTKINNHFMRNEGLKNAIIKENE